MAASKETTSISISRQAKVKVRRFKQDIGISKDNRAMDLIVSLLDSPLAIQLANRLRDVSLSKSKESNENSQLRIELAKLKRELAGLKGSPAPSFVSPFAKTERKDM